MANRRARKQFIGLLISLLLVGLAWYASRHPVKTAQVTGPPPSGTYRIVKFDDGDTIVVDMNGHNETIRFIGVDTPETHKPNTPVQCYGPEAAAFTKQTIGNQPVRLEADPLSSNRDRYNRLLRYVYLPDGTNLDQLLIQQGYGFYYPYFPFTKKDDFHNAETSAQNNKAGLWAHCQPAANSDGGYTSNPIK